MSVLTFCANPAHHRIAPPLTCYLTVSSSHPPTGGVTKSSNENPSDGAEESNEIAEDNAAKGTRAVAATGATTKKEKKQLALLSLPVVQELALVAAVEATDDAALTMVLREIGGREWRDAVWREGQHASASAGGGGAEDGGDATAIVTRRSVLVRAAECTHALLERMAAAPTPRWGRVVALRAAARNIALGSEGTLWGAVCECAESADVEHRAVRAAERALGSAIREARAADADASLRATFNVLRVSELFDGISFKQVKVMGKRVSEESK